MAFRSARTAYKPPSWAAHLVPPSHGRVPFSHIPTPVQPWACPELAELGVEWHIKRDDMCGIELSGNKARKLEFLMAEALGTDCDSVCTIGGLQSNHCRATAAAARLVGLEPHLTVLVRDKEVDDEVGLGGNLLLDRMLGAKIRICTGSDYLRYGGNLEAMDKLNAAAAAEITSQGRRPYIVPVGGTTPVGTWGYLAAVDEFRQQQHSGLAPEGFDHIVVACGSGGTAAGLALGWRLSGLAGAVHAVNVQHTPEVYYELIEREAAQMGATAARDGTAREWLSIINGGGLGYGVSDAAQLACLARVGAASGVVLDHVYTGKALYHFCEHARAHPDVFRGKRILFWHTGGLPGLQVQERELLGLLPPPERLRPP